MGANKVKQDYMHVCIYIYIHMYVTLKAARSFAISLL